MMLSFTRTFLLALIVLAATSSAAPANFQFKNLSSSKSQWKEFAAKWRGNASFRKSWFLKHSPPHRTLPVVPSTPTRAPPRTPPPRPTPTLKPTTPILPPRTTSTAIRATLTARPPISTGSPSSAIAAYLQAHNAERAKHNAKPLKWSQTLATSAAAWGRTCKLEHSNGKFGFVGENLAAGTDDFGIQSAMKLWTDEASDYNKKDPKASHWTQMVWKATTEVGCAAVTCPSGSIFDKKWGSATYYVCQYTQPGNVVGSFSQNIDA